MPRAAAAPPIKKSRRVRHRSSTLAALSSSTISRGLSALPLLTNPLFRRDQLVSHNHGPEVVPSRAGNLRDMDEEEGQIAHREHEVQHASELVRAEQGCKP